MPVQPLERAGAGWPQVASSAGRAGFGEALKSALEQVGALEVEADSSVPALLAQESTDIHTAVIASEKATLGLQLAISVRNKILEAYLEIMRMQV